MHCDISSCKGYNIIINDWNWTNEEEWHCQQSVVYNCIFNFY